MTLRVKSELRHGPSVVVVYLKFSYKPDEMNWKYNEDDAIEVMRFNWKLLTQLSLATLTKYV